MASELPSQRLAVALVFESSTLVARAWQAALQYVMLTMKRLNETHIGARLHIAVVSYGTADTVPSPLLCNRFFIDFPIVIKELKENPGKLGIGQTGSGGSTGMAALEGLVAGIELFDDLCNNSLGATSNINHLFHIAASPPDSSQHPTWNNSPSLDQASWDTLPSELKKRDIHLSSVYLQSHPKFLELQQAASPGATSPWFATQPPHLVLLSGLSAPPAQKAPQKRSGENTNLENTQDSKRPRVSSDAIVPGTHGSSSANPSTVVNQPQPPPHTLPQTAQPTVAPRLTYQQILENVRQSEEQLRNLENSIRNATQMGNTELAQTLTPELHKKRELLMNFKKAIATYTQQMAARQRDQNQQQGTSPASAPSSSSPFNTTTAGNANFAHHHRSISGSQPQHPAVAVKPMPNQDSLLPSRMPMDQNKLSPHPAGSSVMGLNGSPNISAMQPEMMSGVASASGQPQAVNPQTGVPSTQTVWKGLLKWSGKSQQGKKDMHTFVGASSQTPQRCHPDTWPQTLVLSPTPALPMQALQDWMKMHAPALCTFLPAIPAAQNFDTKMNEANYNVLTVLLTERKFFATASWTSPSGAETKNALVFPVKNSTLIGAFFPYGMPELPNVPPPNLLSVPMGNPLANFPPQVVQQLQNMSPEQRNLMMAAIMRQQRERQLANQNQAMSGNVAFGSTTQVPAGYNMGGPMGIHNGSNPFGSPAVNRPNAMLSGPQHEGSVAGDVSHEMLQSFMQRNVEG